MPGAFFAANPAERRRARLLQDRMVAAAERRAVPRLYRVLHGFAKAAADAVRSHADTGAALPALDDMPEALLAVLSPVYREAADRARVALLRDAPKRRTKPLTKDTQGAVDQLIAEWIADASAWKVRAITETTRSMVRRAIEIGEADALTLPERARMIEQRTGGTIARSRARTIARTEAHAAAMSSSLTVVGATVPDVQKIWAATVDARTRDTHGDIDGQMRKLSEAFNVGGAALMYPGDQSVGAPAETINCRCVMVYN